MNDEGKSHTHAPSILMLAMGTVIMLALLFCVMSINTCNKHLGQCYDEISQCQKEITIQKKRTGLASRGALLSIPKELFDMTVRIRVNEGVGSGVIIGKDTILTNFHVVAGAIKVEVIEATGQLGGTVWVDMADGKSLVCSVARFDVARDLAVLKPKDAAVSFDKWVPVSKNIPNIGDPLIAIGAANGNMPLATQGFFARLAGDGRYQMRLTAFWGNSGGPVFNAEGELVGLLEGVDKPMVIQGQIIVPLHITFAIPNNWIIDFLSGR